MTKQSQSSNTTQEQLQKVEKLIEAYKIAAIKAKNNNDLVQAKVRVS